MKPLSVTVHSSDSPVFFGPDEYYEFYEFEKLAMSAAIQAGNSTASCSISVHCTDDSMFQLELELEYCKIMTFQCFCADYLHRYKYEVFQEDQHKLRDVYQYIADIEWVLH